MDRAKLIIIGACLSLGFGIGMLMGWNMEQAGVAKSKVKWKFGENELEIDLEKDVESAPTLMSKIFSEDFSRDGAIGWLKKNHGLYHFSDPGLADEIKELDKDDLMAVRLREICQSHTGPWAYRVDTVILSIPARGYQPKEGFAHACESGKFFRNKVQVYNLDQEEKIEVFVSGKYACPEGLRHSDIQLNTKDAKKLLGTNNFSKYEKGIAVIIN